VLAGKSKGSCVCLSVHLFTVYLLNLLTCDFDFFCIMTIACQGFHGLKVEVVAGKNGNADGLTSVLN